MRPRPFECSITPRSEDIRRAIEREGKQALTDLEQYRGDTQYQMSQFYDDKSLAMQKYGNAKTLTPLRWSKEV